MKSNFKTSVKTYLEKISFLFSNVGDLFEVNTVSVSISIQRYDLLDRAESPCRNDYPKHLKKLLKLPLKPEYLWNSILAPELPYDQRVCENMCVVNHWLPKCNCMMSDIIWYYAGGMENRNLSLLYSFE